MSNSFDRRKTDAENCQVSVSFSLLINSSLDFKRMVEMGEGLIDGKEEVKLEELDWKSVALGIAAPSSLLSLRRARLWRVKETSRGSEFVGLRRERERELSIFVAFVATFDRLLDSFFFVQSNFFLSAFCFSRFIQLK